MFSKSGYYDSKLLITNHEIIMIIRWGRGTAQKHGGFYSGPDRFVPGHVLEHKFEDAMTIDRESWGIRRDIKIDDVYPIDELIGLVAEIGIELIMKYLSIMLSFFQNHKIKNFYMNV